MSTFAHQLLTDCLVAQGFDRAQAGRAVDCMIGRALAAEIIERRHLEVWEVQANIYHLRGKDVRPCDLAVRFTLARSKVFDAIRRHGKRRRAALGCVDLGMVG